MIVTPKVYSDTHPEKNWQFPLHILLVPRVHFVSCFVLLHFVFLIFMLFAHDIGFGAEAP